ncbi:MAG TPA: hypothetical protein VMB77_08715 [Syntrophales bacterium]|nr:hypothetical protein [Syntrophales bacterium]
MPELIQGKLPVQERIHRLFVTVQGFQERGILFFIEGFLSGFMRTLLVAVKDLGYVEVLFVRNVIEGNLKSHTSQKYSQGGAGIHLCGQDKVIASGPICGDDASAHDGKLRGRGMVDPARLHAFLKKK